MKTRRAGVLAMLALAMLASVGGSAARAEGVGAVQVEMLDAPPASSILYSFDGDDQPGGWGWIGTSSAWRDVGVSFQSPSDSKITAITLKVNMVKIQFVDQAKFSLSIYETRNLGEVPDLSAPIHVGKGEILLNKGDDEYYVRFAFDQPVPVQEGAVYTFLLSWDDAAAYQIVAFRTCLSYEGGRMWYRDGREGKLKHLTQSDRPGLTFFVEHSPE